MQQCTIKLPFKSKLPHEIMIHATYKTRDRYRATRIPFLRVPNQPSKLNMHLK